MGHINNTPEPVVAIVVAAGSGSRLGAEVPKALVPVAGVPLLARAVTQLAAGGVTEVVVVAPAEGRQAFMDALADAPIPVLWADGGAERQHSVAHGLAMLPDLPEADAEHQVVLVHDAARAFLPADMVARVVEAVRGGADAVVPVIPVTDSVRELVDDGSTVVDRARLRAVQTPQGFRRGVIEEAHRILAETETIVTDDAAAAEYIGCTVTLVDGSRDAFKVTEPLDLVLAEALVASGGTA
ncbi:MAG: 2-C-methyl-D-erythritol 4-phosphate cytidylyltransferase [Propionibacteriaceae bacterium]|nr:2-C-methyl-D-erythritol 4-phosphate cytidylyltransferase [Propionibacteriaceae bacterium]